MFMYSPQIKERTNEKGEKEYVVRISENERKVFTDSIEAREYLINKISSPKRDIIFWITFIITLLASFCSLVILLSSINENKLVDKNEITQSITNVIRNNGNINNIKHIYNSRTFKKKPLFSNESPKDFYSNETSLSFILNDILVDSYKTTPTDSLYISKLNKILSEYEIINPFDKLENTQIYSFNNIKAKLDSNYVTIQPDINKIVDELSNKNQLVNTYLNKSDISFYISIFALALTLIFSFYQIYQSIKSSREIKRILLDLYNQNTNDNNKD